MSNINQVFDFWRFLRIPEQFMMDQAELGDLILCLKKKNVSTKDATSAIESIALVVRKTDEDRIGKDSDLAVLRTGDNLE